MTPYYHVTYSTEAWAKVEELPEDRRAKFLRGMSVLVTDPFPEFCVKFSDHEVEWPVTNYLTVKYLIGSRMISIITVVELHDTLSLYRDPERSEK